MLFFLEIRPLYQIVEVTFQVDVNDPNLLMKKQTREVIHCHLMLDCNFHWLKESCLCMNLSKAELLELVRSEADVLHFNWHLSLGTLPPTSTKARNLGALFDSMFLFTA